ncbi:hypothetical protein P171DRAFT_518466 [Karstenula rhodostoma CBS 690.94]|uniref:Uncharacterized protein n=1 Tax=Karstenula rhodostoma CBS 690.94 TaxID=1392251 RepID=A0A9P4PPR4_9PLEO|nr:hypothetical protein P171DRAFT_518466 [Karstenula rhodostoma CBS 690.94]
METYFQHQSAFFRLPRELREKIYEYYAYEENGLVYDLKASRMRRLIEATNEGQQNNPLANNDLEQTCKIAADDLQGIAFRVNKLTFTTGEAREGTTYRGVSSIAGRWRCILLYIHKTRISMVLHAAELVTPKIIEQIEERYPTLGIHFRSRLRSAQRTPLPDRSWKFPTGWADNERDGIALACFEQALEYLLNLLLAEDRDRFHQLVPQALGRQIGAIKHLQHRPPWRGLFTVEALPKLLSFRIVPCYIPSDEDICNWESFLTEPISCRELKKWVDRQPEEVFVRPELDLHYESRSTRWFFSAMAIFIDFLGRQSNEKRRYIRNVCLREDRKSVSRPSGHAQGLVSFLKEYPQMRVKWHIGMRDNLLPVGWRGFSELTFFDRNIFGHETIEAIADWFENAQMLSGLGLSPQSISIVLEGRTDEGVFGWNMIKRAAGLQEAMLEILRRHDMPVLQVSTGARSGVEWSYRYDHPCDLPLCFGSTVRDIINNDCVVRLDGCAGELWDLEKLVAARLDWTLSRWREEWNVEISNQELLSDIWDGLKARYGIPGYVEKRNGISPREEFRRTFCDASDEDDKEEDGLE